MAAIVPIRPKYKRYSLSKEQQDCLTYYVLMGCTKQDAFLLFFPEFLKYDDSGRVLKGKLTKAGEQYCKQFFATAEVNDYIRDYKKTFEEKDDSQTAQIEIDDSRKDKALKSLLNQAMSMVESGDTLDPDTLKVLTEIFKKLGILKDEVEMQEAPRRYLPERCSSCLYRSFVESHIETGQIENSCLRCKALDLAKEHGFRYDPKTLLRGDSEK